MRLLKILTVGLIIALVFTPLSPAADPVIDSKIDVKEFRLENGMLFLVVERHATPQVAARVAIRAGSALEESGKTGIAHMLEHMLFKGTKNFGTADLRKDQELQQKIETAYQIILEEKSKRNPDPALVRQMEAEMDRLRGEVQKIYIPQAFSSQLSKNGAIGVNAFTTKDQTQYIMSVPSDMVEQWYSIVSEQLFEPSWREFYVEKEVVQREWAYRYVNSANGAAWLDLNATAYTAHPYKNPTIGWKSDIDRFNTTDAMAFHRKYYHPSNAVCVLVGDIKVKEAKRLAQLYFGRYPAGRPSPESVTLEPRQQGPRKNIRYLKGARTPLIRIGYAGARMGTRDFYALDAMTMILSQGRSARLTQEVINKGLAVQAWAYNPDNRYGGMIILGGSPVGPEKIKSGDLDEKERRRAYRLACEKLDQILSAEIEQMKSRLVLPQELERIKKMNQRDFLDRLRSNESLAGLLATLEVQTGWRYINSYLNKIAEITPRDIQNAARKYIHETNKTSVYVIPGGKPDQPPVQYAENRSVGITANSKMDRPETLDNRSDFPTPRGWKHPLSFDRRPEKIKYPKAKKIKLGQSSLFYLPDRELPLVDLSILVKAGKVDVDESKTGLAQILTHSIIRGGTEKYSPRELAQIIDRNAIKVSISIGEEVSVITLSVIRNDWDKGLALLEEIITRPAFNDQVLNVVKQQALVGLKRQGGDAQSVAMREAKIWHFNGHPYGRDPLKGLATIPGISKKDLISFIQTYFTPSNMVVTVAGDISKRRAAKGVKRLFKALPQTTPPARNLGEPVMTPPTLSLIHKPGQVQSQVFLYLRGIKRSHPDFWKMRLLTDIFGGSDSLMYTRLRDELGLVYTAGFFQTYKWNAGILIGSIGTKPDKTSLAIQETINIMKGLRKDIPDRALELKRLDALNSFVFNVDSPSALVDVYARYHMRGEPLNTLEKIQDAYIHATEEDLHRLANQLLNPERLQVFIVADKNIPVKTSRGEQMTLEKDIQNLARELGLPYTPIKLR